MSTMFKMLAKEIAPGRILVGNNGCSGGNCPSVLSCSDGSLVIVGNKLSASEISALEETNLVKVYDHEFAVRIDPELLKKAVGEL